ncbi:hypothetical protein [Stutzerimonas kirkiae]|uniref:hypothetical protein n=1 Tax=Stutzerimonas kirkiae TaxID=2211392 RepID=UPI001037EEAF|nr:hypothetical protein [Stutzerimonas kirkiae]
MNKEYLQREYPVPVPEKEVFFGLLIAILSCAAILKNPEFFDWFGAQGNGQKLSLQACSAMCAFIGVLLCDINFFRAGFIRRRRGQYFYLRECAEQRYEVAKQKPITREKVSVLCDHLIHISNLNQHFASVLDPSRNAKCAKACGLFLLLVSAVLLLVSAG